MVPDTPWAKGCVSAFSTSSQQVSLAWAGLCSHVLPDTSNDLLCFQPRHHRLLFLHWSLVKKPISSAWLWITPTWNMGWCMNTLAVQESNPLFWRKLWNQKVASISLRRYWKPYVVSFVAKQNGKLIIELIIGFCRLGFSLRLTLVFSALFRVLFCRMHWITIACWYEQIS